MATGGRSALNTSTPPLEAAVTPGTTLLLTFAAVTAGLFVALWGLGAFIQGALYSGPASRLPLRALAGAVLLGGFITLWTSANTRAGTKDRYGVLHEFTSETHTEFTEFDAIRRDRAGKERTVPFKRTGGRTAPFVEAADPSRPFTLTTADYVTTGLEVKEGDGKTRFDDELDAGGKYKHAANKVFRDGKGRRIEFGQSNTPSPIVAKSTGAQIGALLLNAGVFVVWFVVFWPVMRFTLGHALGLAAVFGAVTMLLLMPMLFDTNRVSHQAPPAAVETK
jgi:hypothetical protein